MCQEAAVAQFQPCTVAGDLSTAVVQLLSTPERNSQRDDSFARHATFDRMKIEEDCSVCLHCMSVLSDCSVDCSV